jgi:uncharacterized protein
MPNFDSHRPGAFCWVELATGDQAEAKRFYSDLFAWTANDIPVGADDVYTMFQLNDRVVAAARTLGPGQKGEGIPSHWQLYISTENADSTAERAAGLGARIIDPPFDVFDAGRMAVIQDPAGAIFAIWQAKRHHGIGVAAEDGALCWADLNTREPKKAAEFYSQLFGWEMKLGQNDPFGYLHIVNQDDYIGGIPPASQDPNPPHWLIYYQISGINPAVRRAESGGGKVVQPAFTMPDVGTIAVLTDPQGATFALFEHLGKT